MTDLLSIIVSGLLMGAIYALLAGGLTLIWGVMRIINLAHGEFLMLGAFAAWYFAGSGLVPLLALPVIAPAFFVLGVAVYLLVIRRIVDAPELMSLSSRRPRPSRRARAAAGCSTPSASPAAVSAE